jgi:hypothetical protein
MRWETKYTDYKSGERLEIFLQKFADNEVGWVRKNEYGFSRVLGFKILDQYFEIEWFNNVCILFVGEIKNRPLRAYFDAIYTGSSSPVYCEDEDDCLTFEYEGKKMFSIPLTIGALK